MRRPQLHLTAALLPAVLALGLLTPAAAEEAPAPLNVTSVLATGVLDLQLPAFHDEKLAGVKAADLFDALPAWPGRPWPAAGAKVPGPDGKALAWTALEGKGGTFALGSEEGPAARYLAFYIGTDRYTTAKLQVTGDQPVKAFLDGQPLTLEKEAAEGEDASRQTGKLTLPLGKHLVVVRSLREPPAEGQEPTPWRCGLAVIPAGDADASGLTLGLSPQRPVDIQVILDAPRLGGTEISPDGKLVAVSLSEYRDGSRKESWLEIRDTARGKLQNIWRTGESPRDLGWSPDGKLVCWRTTADEKSTLWSFDPERGQSALLVADVEKMGGWQWAPDSRSILYTVDRKPDEDKRKVKRVLHPADRQSWWRGRAHLMQVFVPEGVPRRLTAGPVSPEGWAVSPDSKRLLFFTGEPDLTARPYSTSALWVLDLTTLAVQKVLEDPWVGGAQWGPDPDLILLQGSPSAFAGLGSTLPAGVQANDYGGQLFLYDLKTGTPRAITRDLRPDVGWVHWSLADGLIYALCTDTQHENVYRCDPAKLNWTRLETGFEATAQLAVARHGSVAVARGSSATTPNRLHTVDLKQNKARLLLDPGAENYRDRVFGKVENWPTVLPNGSELDGFVYYPPDFDPARKYPVIVYYYGGTSPIGRDFGGRYPKNVWAGQGYLVYVPEPSGATGYGQEFAARHVNDWGILTADEVIAGTEAFLAAHPYADAEAVACMGASYGGFLTEYVITRTDLFAAAVSHAGISSISSYWGEGLWGYQYGARALANAFPWQDRDLYVNQSALFNADKIHTPLLLVHGDSDTNVPVGESDQLFTALKLLGREVEYVQIQGQDHWVVDHDQRIVWNDTILAFLAKHLKGRPAWWDAMYPAPEDFR